MSPLLLIERLVMESLSRGEKDIKAIAEDTNLKEEVVENILKNLHQNQLIKPTSKGNYGLDFKSLSTEVHNINSPACVNWEVKELLIALANSYFLTPPHRHKISYQGMSLNYYSSPILRVKKVWLTKDEDIIYNSLLNRLDFLFREVSSSQKKRAKEKKSAEQKIIFWGHSQYDKLVDTILAEV